MEKSFIKVQLVELRKLSVLFFTGIPRDKLKFILCKENEKPIILNVVKTTSINMISMFDLALPSDYEFGKEYSLMVAPFNPQVIDVTNATLLTEFDSLFNYDGDDLGCTYSKEESSFALWAPLATSVKLNIETSMGHFEKFEMTRTDKGVYRLTLKGDFLNRYYSYFVTNSGVCKETSDPYGKGAGPNSEYSGVVDINAIRNMGKVKPTNVINNYVESIIYEVGIRDFTEQKDATDIVNKGKYLGFVEENRKTIGGNPAGLDYLTNLGVTHVQLNPVIDFGTVDDLHIEQKYNWGYDPITMFALEGSYSLHPEIPMERLIEFKTMINKLHSKNIRVILDVVYNHIYEYMTSCFEKVVPGYYFRKRRDGNIACASGCGDDVASEKYMVRKMITDSLKYFIDVFDVDGYRFDLMGLIDITTIRNGFNLCKAMKDDIMFYGEGWNMGLELPYEEKACTDNAIKLPDVAWFNESVRDTVKGPNSKDQISVKGYINGDINYAYGMKYIIHGCCLNISYDAKFQDANQSINYTECHDNNTLFDKLRFSNRDEEESVILNRVKLANGVLMTCFGIPFYHMGQEIGLSKKGNDNTYNVLNINDMDWSLVDKRYQMVNYFKGLIQLRKDYKLFKLHKPEDISKAITIYEADGILGYFCTDTKLTDPNKSLVVLYNPNSEMKKVDFDEDFKVIFSEGGLCRKCAINVRSCMIAPNSMVVLVKE